MNGGWNEHGPTLANQSKYTHQIFIARWLDVFFERLTITNEIFNPLECRWVNYSLIGQTKSILTADCM